MAIRIHSNGSWSKIFEIYLDGDLSKDDTRQLMEIMTWIKNNITGEWRYPKRRVFYFRNKEDAMAFKLRWL